MGELRTDREARRKVAAKEHEQVAWNEKVEQELREIVRLAVVEDIEDDQDWTTVALVPEAVQAQAHIVSRVDGVIAGLAAAGAVLDEMQFTATCRIIVQDGSQVRPGMRVATLAGPAREILTAERVILNTVGRLSGIASLTAQYVHEVAGTGARVYDTRKTTPAWRRLEKYAVRCGGGTNHRCGLNRAVLIKDNHIAFGNSGSAEQGFTVAASVQLARDFVQAHAPGGDQMIIEIEVDSMDQLEQVLPAHPDIVLLDNMRVDQLEEAVALRNKVAENVDLEASGGVNLSTIGAIARTGVDRISVGALTHSAANLDVGLDWSME